jgi:hypothetical protein
MKSCTIFVILLFLHNEALYVSILGIKKEVLFYVLINFCKSDYQTIHFANAVTRPSLTEEHLNWNAFNGNANSGVKNGGPRENNKPEIKPIASSIYKQQTQSPQDINNEVIIL